MPNKTDKLCNLHFLRVKLPQARGDAKNTSFWEAQLLDNAVSGKHGPLGQAVLAPDDSGGRERLAKSLLWRRGWKSLKRLVTVVDRLHAWGV